MSLTLHPLDADNPPDGLSPQLDWRGVALHWRAAPASPWSVQRIAFHALSLTHEDDPPRDADEQQRYVRSAYVLAACSHPIPSDAEVYWEIRW